MHDWFQKMFIDEVKPALERHSSSGGGLKYEMGTYTPEEDERLAVNISHGLVVTPTVTLFFAEDTAPLVGVTGYMVSFAAFNVSVNKEYHYLVGTSNPSVTGGYADGSNPLMMDTQFTIRATSTTKLKAGVTYRWLIAVL